MNLMYKEIVVKRNITDITFMILNMKKSATSISELKKRVSFPVYQEPANQDIVAMLDGKKDDMLIYDRCGLLVDHLRMPYSYMRYPYVWDSLKKVYNNKISECHRHCPTPTTAAPTQSTTAMPVTSQEFSINTTVSVTTQPARLETTTNSSFKILNNQSTVASEEETK